MKTQFYIQEENRKAAEKTRYLELTVKAKKHYKNHLIKYRGMMPLLIWGQMIKNDNSKSNIFRV